MIRCAHGVYHSGTGKPGRTDNPACSVCCALPARQAAGTLTPATDSSRRANDRHLNKSHLGMPVKLEDVSPPLSAPVTNTAGIVPTVVHPRRRKGEYRPTASPTA